MDSNGAQFPGNDSFSTTHWSLVERAGHASPEIQRQALVMVLEQYLPPIRSHLLIRKRIDRHKVDDLIQDFFTNKVLEQEIIARYQRERGKFRTFLLTALDRFLIDRYRYEGSEKRFAKGAVSLDQDPSLSEDMMSDGSGSYDFEGEWARELLKNAIARMRRECSTSGREDLWIVFEARILKPILDDEPLIEYDELVRRFNLGSPVQASNLLITAKRTFTRALRSVVGEYEQSAERIDEEIADMRAALGKGKR